MREVPFVDRALLGDQRRSADEALAAAFNPARDFTDVPDDAMPVFTSKDLNHYWSSKL
jgi:hypothetical protein